MQALASAGAAADDLWALTGGGFEGIGSNNWVIGGSLTESGLPILANDTHLAIQMPSIWFQNGLHCVGDDPSCTYQLVGFSFAGTPGVVIGHNDQIAWGVTTQATDTQDLYIERVNPDDSGQYEVNGEWVNFQVRTETIRVAGGDDIAFDVRSTRHGPVISGTFLEEDELDDVETLDLPEEYVVALSWQTLEPSTLVEAILGLNRATNYEEFRDALRLWDIAAQNVVYADVEGNIAYQATGEIPIRASGDGRYPVPGWSDDHEWVGLVEFDDLPRLFNPPRDWIETANQQVLRPGSKPFLGSDGAYGYRGGRIEEMIEAASTLTVDATARMQMDGHDGGAEHLIPHLLAVPDEGDEGVADIQARLNSWANSPEPFQSSGDSNGAAVYQAVWRWVLIHTFHDELPEDRWPSGGSRWFEVVRNLLETPNDEWWDDVGTSEAETRDDILSRAMADAHGELTDLLGGDADSWTWGQLHTARFENQTLGQSGIGPIEWLFNRTAPESVGGSASIVNANGWDTATSYAVDWVPSQRQVIDLADWDNSMFHHTTGQSGHAFHRFYDNMIESWATGEQGPMHWGRANVTGNSSSTLTMVPAGS